MKPRALTLCCCLAALPLIGCANGTGAASRAQASSPPALAAADAGYPAGMRVYSDAAGAPAAILVMLPGPGEGWTADPALWATQGFDVVAPPPSALHRLAADREAAFDRLIAQAQAMANAPVWLIGPSPAIEAAMASLPPAGAGQVSGVVVTSAASGPRTCSETMTYAYRGNGAAPQVKVSKSGNACSPGSAFGIETHQGVVPTSPAPMSPAAQPHAPRLIEASASADASPSSRHAAVQRVAALIKAASSS
ncbi:MAG: hypothetical protein ACREE9_07750 [Stellaceae bacterium]